MDGESTREGSARTQPEEAVSSERLGERVKAIRRESGLTLDGLAEKAGVSRAMLSKLERGEKNPTLVVAARVAEGLSVTLTQLIEIGERRSVTVTPRDRRRVMRDSQTGFERQEISSDAGGHGLELVYNVVPEGSTSGEFQPCRKGVEGYVVVDRGRLRARLGGEEYLLEAGDAVRFEADVPHRFDNAGEGECGYYLAIYFSSSPM